VQIEVRCIGPKPGGLNKGLVF